MPRLLAPLAVLVASLSLAACQAPANDPHDASPPREGAGGPAAIPAPPAVATPAPVAPAVAPRPAGPGQVLTKTFHSDALGVDKSYLVYLPSGYDGGAARYPVLYMLHGIGGDETNWVKVGHLDAAADALALRAIVVMPDGDDGFYSNWVTPEPYDACLKGHPTFGTTERAETYCVRTARYEDYVVHDLVAHVDATYRTATDRRARAIGGLSMGGFGAMMLAMRHPDLFSAAASHSGVVSLLYGGPHPYRQGAVTPVATATLGGSRWGKIREQAQSVFGGDLDNWRAHDPATLAAKLKEGELAVYVDCGTEDGFQLHDEASHLHEVLDRGGVTHAFALVPGVHDFTLWKARVRESLAFVGAQFQRAGY